MMTEFPGGDLTDSQMSGLRGSCIPVGLYEGRGLRGVRRGGKGGSY